MAVSSRCQGLGVGKQLLRAALDFGENYGYQQIVLETSYNQQQAIRFYESNGFVLVKTLIEWDYVVPFCEYRMRYGFCSKED